MAPERMAAEGLAQVEYYVIMYYRDSSPRSKLKSLKDALSAKQSYHPNHKTG